VAVRAGGRVEIESELGRGTTVRIIVPVADVPGSRAPERPGAVISLEDGRAAAMLRHVLERSGVPVRADGDHSRAEVWVVSPAGADPGRVRKWRRRWPQGRLILFGPPRPGSTDSWGALSPVVIEQPDDFEAVRAAVATR